MKPWPASQRPLSRGELEQLKAGLVSPAPANGVTWWGLLLLASGLGLWGVLTSRLWERHRVYKAHQA